MTGRAYNGPYEGGHLNHVAFPMGGIGAGMLCLEGSGAFSHVSIRNCPEVFTEPMMFAALHVKGENGPAVARVLEGPVPARKVFGSQGAGNGLGNSSYGFPRCERTTFEARFPFASVAIADQGLPLQIKLTGWSPFVPGDADSSSLPVAGLEYTFANNAGRELACVCSFHAANFMPVAGAKGAKCVDAVPGGFVLRQRGSEERPWDEGHFCVASDAPDTRVDCAWFRGGWFDSKTMLWKAVSEGAAPARGPVGEESPSPGGSLFVPFRLRPGESRTVRIMLSWYVPGSDLRTGKDPGEDAQPAQARAYHAPWYAGRFDSAEAVVAFWRERYTELRERSARFAECFCDQTLPPEVVEAVAANLTILKSPTCLRQTDGRFWGWEGCCDSRGCCPGTCSHVWNYAQALPHLFPALERTVRETELNESQDERGHQTFRAFLPIRPATHDFHAAADGQLGGIMRVYREWRICGDGEWLRTLWPRVRQALQYCIDTWDPDHVGALVEPHHNTYDIEFWGPDGMCTSMYLGALTATAAMGRALGEDVGLFEELRDRGRACMETELFDGECFVQKIRWQDLRAANPAETAAKGIGQNYSPEALEMLEREGPKYQYGGGCLSDGVLGAWIGAACGVEPFLDARKVERHLLAVFEHNFKADLSEHANPQRPTFALGHEGGLLLCSWPNGNALSLPFPYSNEVWTGIEYQVAAHLMLAGHPDEGLAIVRAARDRYDGRVRNPFNEYECGHWYARAMSSYGLLQGLTGARYDAVERVLVLKPVLSGDFRAFLCTATGFGTVGVRDGEPFVEVKHGAIDVARIDYTPCRA